MHDVKVHAVRWHVLILLSLSDHMHESLYVVAHARDNAYRGVHIIVTPFFLGQTRGTVGEERQSNMFCMWHTTMLKISAL